MIKILLLTIVIYLGLRFLIFLFRVLRFAYKVKKQIEIKNTEPIRKSPPWKDSEIEDAKYEEVRKE